MSLASWRNLCVDLAKAITKAIADVRANRKRQAPPAPTGAEIAASLKALQAQLPALIAAAERYPGVIAGVDDILDALRKDGVPWAEMLENAIDELPGGLEAAESWLPTALYWLNAFQPMPGKFIGIA